MKACFLFIFFLICICDNTFSQNEKSQFNPEGYGMLYNRKHVNFVSINTQNKTESFFAELTRRFGSPIVAGEYTIYKCNNRKWSEERIVIRISEAIQTELDSTESNTLFIYVETKKHVDLLRPGKVSSERIKSWFHSLFLKEIIHASPDDFSE